MNFILNCYEISNCLSKLYDNSLILSWNMGSPSKANYELLHDHMGGDKTMKLVTKELEKKLPLLYAQDGKGDEAIAYAKFFDPCGSWTWYVTEYDPKEKLCFGLVDGLEKELGYFSIHELESITRPFGLKIERDIHFTPTKISTLM